ncbi:hypothetical protein N7509_003872, partial [Penicillium cosmopolitanum]
VENHLNWIRSVASSHDDHLLASGSDDQTIRLWDLATGTLKHTLESPSDLVFSVAFSSFGKIARLWDPATGVLQQTLEIHSDGVRSVAFLLDSQILASRSFDLPVYLWNSLTGALQKVLESRGKQPTDLEYLKIQPSPDTTGPNEPDDNMFFIEDQWVDFAGEYALWLPPKYRPDPSTGKGNRLAWGHAPVRVSIIEFLPRTEGNEQ